MLPALFIAHGSPMVAIEETDYSRFLQQLGKSFPKPKSVVVFSAHWESPVQMVSAVSRYSTIYDFGGFPEELYQINYAAPGNKDVSRQIQQLFAGDQISYNVETKRGLDHGAWTILRRLYPEADVPVVELSVNPRIRPQEQYRIGKALAPLRGEGVLIIGSGVTVHNFQLLAVRNNPKVREIVNGFEDWLEAHLELWDLTALFDFEAQAPYASIAVPAGGNEHFVPLFYAMGAADATRVVHTLYRGLEMGVMTNSIYQFG
ncbi:MAG: dioxygenase [Sulfobacillus benefaciens]|uniref:Dioxygenase n=1 Tax=Sulfobacillus benefaciens TaxID=453960 RepID=A0A2T2XJR1_9FIRM|nr:MAG: dioxygenase [Sulfobacillus benefaciens]